MCDDVNVLLKFLRNSSMWKWNDWMTRQEGWLAHYCNLAPTLRLWRVISSIIMRKELTLPPSLEKFDIGTILCFMQILHYSLSSTFHPLLDLFNTCPYISVIATFIENKIKIINICLSRIHTDIFSHSWKSTLAHLQPKVSALSARYGSACSSQTTYFTICKLETTVLALHL